MNTKPVRNELTGILETRIVGTLMSLPTEFKNELKNEKKTPYSICQVEIAYPNGTKATVSSRLYKATQEFAGYSKGSEVELVVQCEGTYAGRSIIALPEAKVVDLSLFGIEIAEEVTSKA